MRNLGRVDCERLCSLQRGRRFAPSEWHHSLGGKFWVVEKIHGALACLRVFIVPCSRLWVLI